MPSVEEGLPVEVLTKKRKNRSKDFWESMARDARVGTKMQAYAQEQLELHWGVRPQQSQKHEHSGSLGGPPAVVVTEIVVTTREEAKAILAQQAEEKRLADQKPMRKLYSSRTRTRA